MRYAYREFYRDSGKYADRIFVSEDTFAVADGMGDMEGGRRSAELAVKLVSFYRPFKSSFEVKEFFKFANKEIMKEVAKLGDRAFAGTTLSLLSINCNNFVIGHIGDSRVYLFRDDRVQKLTRDHVFFKGNRVYIKALGLDWKLDIFSFEGKVREGDVFIVASDGLRGTSCEEKLEELIEDDPEVTADNILRCYLKDDGGEDLSFIVIRVD